MNRWVYVFRLVFHIPYVFFLWDLYRYPQDVVVVLSFISVLIRLE